MLNFYKFSLRLSPSSPTRPLLLSEGDNYINNVNFKGISLRMGWIPQFFFWSSFLFEFKRNKGEWLIYPWLWRKSLYVYGENGLNVGETLPNFSQEGRQWKKVMATSSQDALFSIKKLDGTNFPFWKKQIWQVLVQKKQIKPIKLKGEKLEDIALAVWEELDELAWSTIMLILVDNIYFNVAKEEIAYGVWLK